MVVAGNGSTELADVKNDTPSTDAFGLVVRVTGAVNAAFNASSSQVFPIQMSTAVNTAFIDPRQVTVIGGTSGAGIGTIISTAAGSAAIDPRIIPAGSTIAVAPTTQWTVSIAGTASSAVLGTVLSATGLAGAAIDPRQATIVAATSGAVLWTVGAGSSGVTGTSLISTGLSGAAIDPRQATIVGGTSGAGVGTIVSTAAGSAAIDPRQATIVGGTSGAGLGTIISTAAGAAAIDPRQVTLVAATSGAFVSTRWSTQTVNGSTVIDTVNEAVRVNIVAGSAAGATAALLQIQSTDGTWTSVGYAGPFALLTGITTAHNSTTIIDPRAASLTASSSQTFPIQNTTAPNTAYIDPRQATIVAATSGAVLWTVGAGSSGVTGTTLISTALAGSAIDPRQATIVGGTSGTGIGTIVSTAAGAAAIDPRQSTIVAATSGAVLWTVGAGSSGVTGTSLISTALAGAAIDPRQATIVAGTSGAGLGTILSTGAGGASIDPRARTWNLSTSDIGGSILLSSAQSFVMATTTVPSTDAMALVSRLTSSSSGQTIGNVTVSTGSVALYSSTGAAIAVTTQSPSSDAMAVVVRIAEASSAVDIGAVVVSTAGGGLRAFTDSTGTYNQVYYWTTGIAAAAAATMQSLNFTKNLSSGSSGTSFNVSAGKIFRIQYVNMSIRVTSGTDLYADFAIRAVTTTGGATGTNFPVFYQRIVAQSASTVSLAVGVGGDALIVSGLEIDLPSSASFGVSIVSNSTASQECTIGFGGKEYTI